MFLIKLGNNAPTEVASSTLTMALLNVLVPYKEMGKEMKAAGQK